MKTVTDEGLPEHPNLTLLVERPKEELTPKQLRIVTAILEHAEVMKSGNINISPVRQELKEEHGDTGNNTSYIYQILGQHFVRHPPGNFEEIRSDETVDVAEANQQYREGFMDGFGEGVQYAQGGLLTDEDDDDEAEKSRRGPMPQ